MVSDALGTLHIFDCDGVIFDSNKPKLDALRGTLISLGCPMQFVDWAVEDFRKNFGRTRQQHFNVFKRHRGCQPFRLEEEVARAALKQYGSRVESLYGSCNVILETSAYISELPTNDRVFVVSASDQLELRQILPSKIPAVEEGCVFGGPASKVENLSKVVEMVGYNNIIFYGDAVQDANAAIKTGITFLGLSKYSADPQSLEFFCSENGLNCVSSFSEVSR